MRTCIAWLGEGIQWLGTRGAGRLEEGRALVAGRELRVWRDRLSAGQVDGRDVWILHVESLEDVRALLADGLVETVRTRVASVDLYPELAEVFPREIPIVCGGVEVDAFGGRDNTAIVEMATNGSAVVERTAVEAYEHARPVVEVGGEVEVIP